MSNWAAIEKGAEAISAWEFRGLYLKDGTKYEEFFCPFCDIKLAAVLVYAEGELSKSPHFSAKWGDHVNECNGEPLLVATPTPKRPEAHYIPREMHFPEAFSDRPPPRKQRPAGAEKGIVPPTSLETSTRRRNAGSLGRPIPRTYLLQPIVEAYNSVWKDSFDRAKKENWTEDFRLQWAKNYRAAMPLRLDDSTNYGDAFRTPSYVHGSQPRIYHGNGKVRAMGRQYLIEGTANSKKLTAPLHCSVAIESNGVPDLSPKWHRALLSKLEHLVGSNEEVRWYAYGRPAVSGNSFLLTIENLDYLYVKSAFSKPQQ